MKKTIPALFICLGASAGASAADGTIQFTGEVTAQTCTVNGNGGSADFTVALPKVATSSLKNAGDSAGTTAFNIGLSNCSPTTGSVHTFWEAGPTVDVASGRLNLDAGGASNVQIELLNNDLTSIKAGFTDSTQNSKSASIASGKATLQYYARYYATGQSTAGLANSSVQYTVAYE